MTVSAETDRNVIQALAQVARLGQYTLVSVTTSDDAEKRTLTIKLAGVSSGFVQDTLPYDDLSTPLIAHANGRGEVEGIEGLQPGDLAETEAQANAEIAAAEQVEQLPEGEFAEGSPIIQEGGATDKPREGTEVPVGVTAEISADPDDAPRDPEQPLVGELAAAARRRR